MSGLKIKNGGTKPMKRALALLIALTAAFGVATTSFAETSDAPGTSSTREDGIYFENAGTVSISDLLEPGRSTNSQ